LPFSKDIRKEIIEFAKKENHPLKIFDCAKGNLFKEYFKIIQNPKYARGSGVNPCIDCKIFMFRKVKEFADKKRINLIITGEVLGERPMSQTRKQLCLIEESSGLNKRILRPLSANLLEETYAEKKKIIDRKNLYSITGRRRIEQIALAKEFRILNYPSPAGGCLLCEKQLKKRFIESFQRRFNEKQIKLLCIGRHFLEGENWIVLGRNEYENKILESFGKAIISNFPAPSALILGKINKKARSFANELIIAYSKKGSIKSRKKFDKWKL